MASGTPLSILFEILGIDEAKAKLEGLAPSLDNLAKKATETGTKIGQGLGDPAKFTAAQQGIDKVSQSQDKLSASSTKAAGEMTKVGQSASQLGGSTGQASGATDKLKSSQEGLAQSGTRVNTELTKERTTTQQLGTETQKASTSTDKLATSTQKVGQEAGKADQNLKKTKDSIKGVADEGGKAGTNLNKTKDGLDKTGDAADKATAKTASLKTNFASLGAGVTTLSTSLVSLWQTYDSLGDAQLKVDAANLKLSKAQENVTKTTQALNELIAQGVTSGAAYEQAVLDVTQAKEMEAVSTGRLQNAQEDLNITQANFYTQIIPQVIGVLGSLGTIYTTLNTTIGTFKKTTDATAISQTALGVATGKTTVAVGFLDKAMKFMSLSNPFFLALTIGAGILTAFVTNLFGFRDAMNSIGVAIGEAVGPLKPFLTLIGDLGNGLADFLSGGGQDMQAFAEETETAMGDTTEAIEGVAPVAKKTFADLKQYGLDLSQAFIDSSGKAVGWSEDFSTATASAASATEALPQATGAAVDDSIDHLKRLTDEYVKVRADLQKMFSKSENLGSGITLTGFAQADPNTRSNLGKEASDRISRIMTDPGAIDVSPDVSQELVKLTEVTTRFDGVTKILHVNLGELRAQMDRLGISTTLQAKIEDELVTKMDASLETTSRNISGVVELDEAKNRDTANRQRGIQVLDLENAKWDENGNVLGMVTTNQKSVSTATKETTAVTEEGITVTEKVNQAQQERAKALEETKKAELGLQGSSVSLTDSQDRLATAMVATSAELQYYNDLTTDAAMQTAFSTEAQRKQTLAQEAQKWALIETVTMLQEYNEYLGTAEGATVAFAAGMAKQYDAFVKSKATMYETHGVLVELNKEFVTGEPQAIAYATAWYQAEIDMRNAQITVSKTRAEVAVLEKQVKSGEAQITAFAQSFLDTNKKILQNKVNIEILAAEVSATAKSWKDYHRTLDNSTQGMVEADKALLDLADSMEKNISNTKRYIELVKSGAVEQAEYTNTYWDTKRAIADTSVEVHRAMAEYNAFNESITDTAEQTDRANLSFMEGKRAIQDWYMQAATATDNTAGMYTELKTLAEPLGGIPPLIDGNIEAMKEWIAIQKGFPDAVQNGLAKAADMIEQGFEDIKEAVKSNNNLNSEEMDELFGINLPDSFEKRVEVRAVFEVNEEEHTKKLNNLLGQIITEAKLGTLTEKEKSEIGKRFMKALGEALENGEISTEFYNKVRAIFDNLPEIGDTAGWTEFATEWGLLTSALEQGDWTTAENILNVIGTDRSTSINNNAAGMDSMSTAIAAIATKYGGLPSDADIIAKTNAFKELTGSQMGVGNIPFQAWENYKPPTPTTPTTTTTTTQTTNVDTSALDSAMTKMEKYTQALALLGPATGEAVKRANAEFDLLNPAGPGFQANLATFGTVLNTMPQAVNVAVTNTNKEFDLLNPASPGFQANVAIYGSVLVTLAPATKVGVDAANKEFELLGSTLKTTVLPAIAQFVTDVNTGPFATLITNAGNTAQSVSDKFKTESPKMVTHYNSAVDAVQSGPFSALQRHAATAAQAVTNIFKTEAPKLSSAYDSAIASVKTAFDGLETEVKANLNNIFESAKTASEQVAALIGLINQLEDKTVTITTVYETVGSPAYGATGFGPAIVDHPTKLIVGESGPEYVQVTPLSTAAGKNLTAEERLMNYSDPGKRRLPSPLSEDTEMAYLAQGTGGTAAGGQPIVYANQSPIDYGGPKQALQNVKIAYVGNRLVTDSLPVYGMGGSIAVGASAGSNTVGQGTFGGGSNQTQSGTNNYNNQSDTNTQSNTGTGGNINQNQSYNNNTGGGGGGGGGTAIGGNNNPPGYTPPAGLQTSGNGPRWQNQDMNPEHWQVKQMEDDPSKYKITDANNKNIVAGFESEAEADYYLQQHRNQYLGQQSGNPNYNPGTATGGQPNTGGSQTALPQASNLHAMTFPGGDTYASISAPSHLTYGPPDSGRYVAHQNGADRNRGPEDWFIKSQGGGRFKIVNGLGQDIAVDFDSVNDAQQWINWQIQEIEKRTGKEVGSTTLPLYRDVNTGQVYSQDPHGNLYTQNFDFSDYGTDPNATAIPVRQPQGGGGGGGGGTAIGDNNGQGPIIDPGYTRRPDTGPEGFYRESTTRQYSQIADVGASPPARQRIKQAPGINMRNEVELLNGERYTVEEWNAIPDTHRKVLAENQGFFAIPEGSYINEDYTITPNYYQRPLNSRSGPNPYDPNATRPNSPPVYGPAPGGTGGTTNPPPTTGGGTTTPPPTTGGGTATGNTIPGYNGNFNYMINGRQLQITGGVITKNTLTAADWPAADAAFFKMTGKHLPPYNGATPGTPGSPGTGNLPVQNAGNTPFVNPGFATGHAFGRAPVDQGMPGLDNSWMFNPDGVVVTPPAGTTPTTPTIPGIGRIPWPQWIKDLTGIDINEMLAGVGGIGTGTGTSGSFSKQWTDANGNNFNVQIDNNTQSNVSGNGATALGLGTGLGQTLTMPTTGTTTATALGAMSVNPNGVITMGNGTIVDGANGIVTMNGMVVDGKNGKVIMTDTSGGGTAAGGSNDLSLNNILNYPTRALTGETVEPVHGRWRSGQDLSAPFFDTAAPSPFTSIGNFGYPLGPVGTGTGGGFPNIPGGGMTGIPNLDAVVAILKEFISSIFGHTSVNLFNTMQIDTNKIYETQKKIFGLKQGTMIK